MREKLSFNALENICHVLGKFAEMRSKEPKNKNIILTIKKINGREILQIAELSKLSWLARLIRWFGFGGSTLKSVASFLQNHEPYIPKFSHLKNKELLSLHYTEEAVDQFSNIKKEKWIQLKEEKVRGCEIFKRCLLRHNETSRFKKIYISFKEEEKSSVDGRTEFGIGSLIAHSNPNPMTPVDDNETKHIHERYRTPISFSNLTYKSLGFCYEHGLGIEANKEKAIENYHKAIKEEEYSACYNLGRLYLEDNTERSIVLLKQAEKILLKKIKNAEELINRMTTRHLQAEEQLLNNSVDRELINNTMKTCTEKTTEANLLIVHWNKALKKVYLVLVRACDKHKDLSSKEEYEKKIGEIRELP